MWPCKVVIIVLLSALSKGELPEDDFRIINKEELLSTDTDIFEDNGSKSFSQLLFDVARDQVIVGARDVLYRLSLRGLRELERSEWPASAEKAKACQDKGQTEDDCHNYIKVLLVYGHKLFACGTCAFSPECSWREIESVNTVSEWVTGVANCPLNPHSNLTAIVASTGEYYAGTPTDFSGSETVIIRSHVTSLRNTETLRTTQYDLNWLNEPQFVGSFEDDTYVYFVFREVAVEYMNCGTIIYSRIARVCKNDPGGYLMMKDKWSTFLKARLQCSVPGDVQFNYDEVQSIEYLMQEKIIVATFTTPSNSIVGSAVCIYNMSDVHAAFDGPYKVQESQHSIWEPKTPSRLSKERFRCETVSRHDSMEYEKYYLMHDAIQPIHGEPVYRVTSERFTHVTADVTSARNVDKQYVLFVATQSSKVLKLAVLPEVNGACLVEIWNLKDENGGYDILSMQFVKDTMSVYLGTGSGVVRVGGERCARRAGRAACVRAADPHCGWDDARDACLRALPPHHLLQDTATCDAQHLPVDGGWSSWSGWEECEQDGTPSGAYADGPPDKCQCRTRRCNNPTPRDGGQPCEGASISVTNCTVHGGWSAWSAWSACSATCGIALKSRRRACSAPEPRHGGRVCVGFDSQDIYCNNLPPCPDPALAAVDGGWSPWSAWSACAAAGGGACGPGVRERRRACAAPAPARGGADCDGPRLERQLCDLKPCEVRKATAWSPWVQIPSNLSDGSYTEKRFKFTCKAPSSEQIRLSLGREEERYCSSAGSCSSTPTSTASAAGAGGEAGWAAWGAWGACSAACGGGQQRRERRCLSPPCAGAPDMLRACNTHPCTGQWSCWSDWSDCNGGCSDGALTGHRTRTRMCLSPEGCADAGAALEKRTCLSECTESSAGWGAWGAWGPCEGGLRARRRACPAPPCAGAPLQTVPCDDDDDLDNELNALPAYTQNVEMASFVTTDNRPLGLPAIIGCVVAAFILGCSVCLAAAALWWRRGRGRARVPSSPHYISSQNTYVTVPLKDVPRKAKRQPSFSGIGSTSGLVLPKSNNINLNHNTTATPKLYPKAIANEYDSMGTLKRHSTQPTHKNNFDAEEDKFY